MQAEKFVLLIKSIINLKDKEKRLRFCHEQSAGASVHAYMLSIALFDE